MKIGFGNYWLGNSMKDGGCFPIYFFRVDADIHPSYRFFEIIIFNFGVSIEFPYKFEGVTAIWNEEK